jgi:hypothetical protein
LYLIINVFAAGEGFHPDIRSGPTVSQFVRGGSIGKQRLGIKIEFIDIHDSLGFFTVSCFARCLIYINWLIFLL